MESQTEVYRGTKFLKEKAKLKKFRFENILKMFFIFLLLLLRLFHVQVLFLEK